MKIFLDFDDVLFNTREFIEEMKSIFESCGIPKASFQKAYQEVKVDFDQNERTYDFDAHIRKLQQSCSFDEKNLRDRIRAFVGNGGRFLFPDVKNFVASINKENFSTIVLSFGTSDFQKEKIMGTGIQSSAKIIVTPGDKVADLRKEIGEAGHGIWFFDDRMKYIEGVKRAFPGVKTVLVQRAEGRYHDEPNGFCDYTVKDFVEAEKILRKHLSFLLSNSNS